MPAADSIPRTAPHSIAWSTNFFTVLNENLATVGQIDADIDSVSDVSGEFAGANTDQLAKVVAAAEDAVQTKKMRRTVYYPGLRALVRCIKDECLTAHAAGRGRRGILTA